jgi:hypothetical protein
MMPRFAERAALLALLLMTPVAVAMDFHIYPAPGEQEELETTAGVQQEGEVSVETVETKDANSTKPPADGAETEGSAASSEEEKEFRASLRLATWNVHGGMDGESVYSLDRIAQNIAAGNYDVVALQEIEKNTVKGKARKFSLSTGHKDDQPKTIADKVSEATEVQYYAWYEATLQDLAHKSSLFNPNPTEWLHTQKGVSYGNAILSRRRILKKIVKYFGDGAEGPQIQPRYMSDALVMGDPTAQPRLVMAALIEGEYTEDGRVIKPAFWFLCTHLDHRERDAEGGMNDQSEMVLGLVAQLQSEEGVKPYSARDAPAAGVIGGSCKVWSDAGVGPDELSEAEAEAKKQPVILALDANSSQHRGYTGFNLLTGTRAENGTATGALHNQALDLYRLVGPDFLDQKRAEGFYKGIGSTFIPNGHEQPIDYILAFPPIGASDSAAASDELKVDGCDAARNARAKALLLSDFRKCESKIDVVKASDGKNAEASDHYLVKADLKWTLPAASAEKGTAGEQ